jgi:ubiquinone/menaquinone biosynthesis C-methylase UbiE
VARKFDAAAAARTARMYATPEIAEQRARTRAALGARPGERGLDIGCGPGFLSCELAREVSPRGGVVAIDESADMLVASAERARQEAVADRVRLVRGDATRLPFRPASFDFVVAVQVYLYVPDVVGALAEAARVLRPGGRLVVVDTDWESCVWLTADPDRHRQVMEARLADFAHAHLPPQLPALLRRAGLVPGPASAIPVLSLSYDPASFSGGIIEPTKESAVRQGVPRADAEAWAADLRGRTGDGDYFFSVNRFLFVATRPG